MLWEPQRLEKKGEYGDGDIWKIMGPNSSPQLTVAAPSAAEAAAASKAKLRALANHPSRPWQDLEGGFFRTWRIRSWKFSWPSILGCPPSQEKKKQMKVFL